jgi:hypothetical protein
MSEPEGRTKPEAIGVDQLTEAITNGVLRALGSQGATHGEPVDFLKLASDRGIFGQVVILCGIWPNGKEPPVIGDPGTVRGTQGSLP